MTADRGQDGQDTHPEGKAPEGDGTSPGGEPKTYTQAQLDEAVDKAAQKARVDAGRDAKSLEERENALKEREAAVARWQRERDEEAEAEARNDPARMSRLQSDREARKRKAELDERERRVSGSEREHEERLRRADEILIENNIIKAAVANHLDIDALTEKCQKLNLTTEEQIAEMAQTMAVSGGGLRQPIRADSGVGVGGESNLGKSGRQLIVEGLAELDKKQ